VYQKYLEPMKLPINADEIDPEKLLMILVVCF